MQPVNGQKKNGLQMLQGLSQVESTPENWQLSDLEDFIKTKFGATAGLAVFYLDYAIRFAKWDGQALKLAEADEKIELGFLQLARIFNQERELKIWRGDEGFSYRLRIDGQGEECYAVEARQNLWGTRAKPCAGKSDWAILYEDRGTELTVPLKVAHIEGRDEPLVFVKTRNYIGKSMAYGQATYVDCRFVELGKMKA